MGLQKTITKLDMWHSSNWKAPEYVQENQKYLSEPSSVERAWFKEEFEGQLFTKIRQKYIATFKALQDERDFKVRGRILGDWRKSESDVRASKI